MDLKEEDILGEAISEHWYYRSKSCALLDYVKKLNPQSVLDVGAGSGFFSKELLKKTSAKEALCIDTSYPQERSETISGKPVRYCTHSGPVNADLVLMMDVLEHVDDDVGLLREYSRHLPAHGRVLITVPAFRFLWSGHDEFLEHRRRYTRGMVERMVRDAGLEVVRSRYFYGLLFPAVAAMRLYEARRRKEPQSALRRHSPLANSVLTAVHDVERVLLFPVNVFAGLSVFCLAGPRR